MAEEEHTKKARLATAVLAGSALALSSFAFVVPAAVADQEQKSETVEPTASPTSETPEPTESQDSQSDASEDESSPDESSPEESDDPVNDAADDSTSAEEETEQPSATGDEASEHETAANSDNTTLAQEYPDANFSPSEGYVGDTITVEGSGFTANTPVELVMSPQTLGAEDLDLGSVEVDGEGNIVEGASFTVPDGANVGSHYVEFGDAQLALSFNVISDNDEDERIVNMSLSPGAGPSGTDVDVRGSGFLPEGDVELTMTSDADEVIVEETAVADDQGYIETELTVPEGTPEGIYKVRAEDVASQSTTSSDFNVTNATLSIVPAEISDEQFMTDPADGGGVTHTVEGLQPGDEVFFNVGNAFNPMEHLSGSATADEDGVAEYVVYDTGDNAYVGGYSTTVTLGEGGPHVASGSFEVTSESPQVSLSDDPVVQGGSVLVSGYNFSADADVTIDWDPAGELLETQASETGELTYELLVPEEAELGTHDVVVTDENTDQSVTLELTVIANDDSAEIEPEITLSVDEGYQGQSLTVVGTGFTPEGEVEVVLGDQVMATTANDAGDINQRVGIPVDFAAGTYDLTARDVATDQETSAELTVLEATEPTLVISPEEITLNEFIRDSEDENDQSGVVHTIVGLEEGDELEAIVDGPEGVETVEREETVDASGVVEFDIYGYDSVDPTTYLGTYDAEITIVDSENEPLRGSFEVVEGNDDEAPGEHEEISLSTDEAYPGDSLNITGSGFTPGDEVIFNLNPDIGSATVDANGALDADVTIPEDVEPGEYDLTARNEAADESATAALTILDPADQVTEPALTIDPEEIDVDDFMGDPEDGAGVEHSVQGVAPGSEITYVVTGPEGVSEFESSGYVNDDGTAEFVIYAPEISNPAVYLGEYTTVVTYENENGETGELQGNFSVVGPAGDAGAGDSGDQADPVAGGEPVNLNGLDTLATTGAGNVQLGLLAGVLLALGGAFVVYANRGRLFGRKH